MEDYIQANTDGELCDAREALISPLNRGYLYGDAVYEVWRTHGGHLFAFERHWQRLLRSAAALHLTVPFSPEECLQEIRRTIAAYEAVAGEPEAFYVRLQLTRGGGLIGLDPSLADRPSWTLLVRALAEPEPEKLERGLHLEIADLRRNPPEALDPAWKTGNYLNNLLALREAKARGADEVLLLNLRGAVTEASTRNVFFVKGIELVTPPLSDGILEGVTRGMLLELVQNEGDFTAHELSVFPEDFSDFSECFLTSTTQDLVPVRSIGKAVFTTGPGSVGLELRRRFREWAVSRRR